MNKLIKSSKTTETYPWPIFSNLVYFFLGSPTLTIVRNNDKTSSSLSFAWKVYFMFMANAYQVDFQIKIAIHWEIIYLAFELN